MGMGMRMGGDGTASGRWLRREAAAAAAAAATFAMDAGISTPRFTTTVSSSSSSSSTTATVSSSSTTTSSSSSLEERERQSEGEEGWTREYAGPFDDALLLCRRSNRLENALVLAASVAKAFAAIERDARKRGGEGEEEQRVEEDERQERTEMRRS